MAYNYVIECIPLYKATTEGEWETAKRIFEEEKKDLNAFITYWWETTLHIAVETNSFIFAGDDKRCGWRGWNRGAHGADLLSFSISADFYDVALYLVRKYPDMVPQKNIINSLNSLQILATKSRFGFWQRLIYSWIPVNREKALESPIVGISEVITTKNRIKASSGLNISFWSVLQYLAPHIKQIHDIKVKHIQAEDLVKQMCSTVVKKVDHVTAWDVLGTAISTAEKVYNLVYQMSGHKAYVVADSQNGENSLHYAGKLAPPHRLNTLTGAAFQMQQELQWFKEVEKLVKPSHKEALNNENNTPRMVFTFEHKELLKEAQEWMKSTSSSATIVAALIVTIAFAAIFSTPGGNNDAGKPLFLTDSIFILFVKSDAVALFSSSTSVLMFLSILSSCCAEDDFLYALPKILTLGLISLFISIAATMVAFSAALSLVIRDEIHWIAAPVILLAAVPVTLFLLLQYPLLVELVRSTYGSGLFYKQNNLLLH
ncbi:PGG domain-containing protein [Heracleum sosnowskyi]|uniref:PGG domain-containing protein n=1 Tax=Heracleum sosnowskyi TaxID=360622 RepID=A0AAD8H6F6_9APIA|nr:PGG domain-containing protein [Heracleum sosnowskyi]